MTATIDRLTIAGRTCIRCAAKPPLPPLGNVCLCPRTVIGSCTHCVRCSGLVLGTVEA